MPILARFTSRFSGSGSLAWSATSDDPSVPTSRQLYEISALTFKSSASKEIYSMLEKRLKSSTRNWKNISKALTVCKYLVIHGSSSCILWLSGITGLFRQLTNFTHSKPENTKTIRDQSRLLLDLIQSPEKRNAEKEAYNRTREQVRTSIGRSSTSRNTLDIVRHMEEEEEPPRTPDFGRTSLTLSLGAIQEET